MNLMKRPVVAVLAACLLSAVAPSAATASVHPMSVLHIINQTTDGWIRATAIAPGGAEEGSWCVAPGASVDRTLRVEVASVRGDVGRTECPRAHGVVFLTTDGPYYQQNKQVWVLTAYLRAERGRFTFTK